MNDDLQLIRMANAVLQPGFAGTCLPDWVRARIHDGLGSVILFAGNVDSPTQLRALTDALRAENPDVLIAVDEEGGDITRLEAATGSSYPGNLALGVVDDLALTEAVSHSIGTRLCTAGIDFDYAPVADVNTNPRNPVIGCRSFGADPALVSRHVGAAIRGLHRAGVAACAKHFPGHGDTAVDSHLTLPMVAGPLDAALEPFRAAVTAGVRAVMVGHLLVPALDAEYPASVSARVIGGLLRRDIGFDGLAVTDGIAMAALKDRHGLARGTVLALRAGMDLVCVDKDTTAVDYATLVRAVVGAVRSGVLPEERLAEAVARVHTFTRWQRTLAAASTPVGTTPITGADAARRAVRILRCQQGALPITTPPHIVEIACTLRADIPGATRETLDAAHLSTGRTPCPAERPLLIVVRDPHRRPQTAAQVSALLATRPDAVIVDLGLPILDLGGSAWIAAHGASPVCARAAVAALTATAER
jgi:beta-N-acetylhexosaminidase